MRTPILILGGTTEARELAQQLAPRVDLSVVLSLAGRTRSPAPQPVPSRRGGFGGTVGLVAYLREHAIAALIDATHPYAATMSAHACEAVAQTKTPLVVLQRPAWQALADDRWEEIDSIDAAIARLQGRTRNVFLAVGRQELAGVSLPPQHHYIIRSVDAIEPPLKLPHALYIEERGPFDAAAELALMTKHHIEVLVAKNSGGTAAYGKMLAARALQIEVLLLSRPPLSGAPGVESVREAIEWLDHVVALERGV